MPNREYLRDRIREARENANLTQKELASAIDVSLSYISTLERGTRTPSPKVLEKIAKATNCAYAWLLGDIVPVGSRLAGTNLDCSLQNLIGITFTLIKNECSNMCMISEPWPQGPVFQEVFRHSSPIDPAYILYIHNEAIQTWQFKFSPYARKEMNRQLLVTECDRIATEFLAEAIYIPQDFMRTGKYSLVVYSNEVFESISPLPSHLEMGNISVIQVDLEKNYVVREKYLCRSKDPALSETLDKLCFGDNESLDK